jgi:Tfp pilus assembly protein FimT
MPALDLVPDPARGQAGRTYLELALMLCLMATAFGIGMPRAWRLTEEYKLRGASLYMRSLMRQVRAKAAAENRYAGIVFEDIDGDPVLAVHLDGNGNGIRRREVASGVDGRIGDPRRLSEIFSGVRYGQPPSGSGSGFPGLRIGRSDILSFSPLGQSTSGTVFLSNRFGSVHAVVVFGATGRVRVRRYLRGRWEPVS